MVGYKIQTLKDMIDYTNEDNLDRFLNDLEVVLRTTHALEKTGLKVDESFIWVDDGKNISTINIKTK